METTSINPYQQRKLLRLLALFSCFGVGLGMIRIGYSGNIKGIFLVWNLFLAWIPILMAFLLVRKKEILLPFRLTLIFGWLLFLPNAPYLITDLIHLRPRDGVPLWFDASIIFIFAFHGLLLGIISTLLVHEMLLRYLTPLKSWIFLSVCFLLSGYGIYLGRVLRWNSWDIVTHPVELIRASLFKLTNLNAIAMTGVFSLLLLFSYLIFYQLIHFKNSYHDTKNN